MTSTLPGTITSVTTFLKPKVRIDPKHDVGKLKEPHEMYAALCMARKSIVQSLRAKAPRWELEALMGNEAQLSERFARLMAEQE